MRHEIMSYVTENWEGYAQEMYNKNDRESYIEPKLCDNCMGRDEGPCTYFEISIFTF